MERIDLLREIGRVLKSSTSIMIYPHIHADGDALGSAVALCKALRQEGKTAYVLIEDDISENLKFLDKDYCTSNQTLIEFPDVSLCIDCGDEGRFPMRKEAFAKGKTKICIDHHSTTKPFADYNYIDPSAAATGEIVFDLLNSMNWLIDKEMGEALFAAIATDTGNFQYSNATKRTHEIIMKLYDTGMNHSKVCVEIYENVSFNKLELNNLIMSTAESFAEGKAIIAHVSQDMLNQTGTTMDQTEDIVSLLRSIKGIEISALLKEKEPGNIKVSMRAKSYANVSQIASMHDGGGHVKAAGCTLSMTIEEARQLIKQEISNVL